jgi:hypothetical protein
MFPLGDREIRLAMLGMVDGNGHPYSWSAIFNGYDREAMRDCPYATIPNYLGQQPSSAFGIPGARVTHIWTDDPTDAEKVAKASLIPHVVERPEAVIGEVDAVIIATDKGHEHVERCRPFVEAGLPVFVDKPLVDNAADLAQFNAWIDAGAPLLTSSCMRYCKEYAPFRLSTANLGTLRYVTMSMAKSWERYGIHALEGIYAITGPGYLSVRNTGTLERNIVHLRHRDGLDVVLAVTADMFGGFGALQLVGTAGCAQAVCADTFFMFKAQLVAFIDYLRTGVRPFPHAETDELMRIIIAGIQSREAGGAEIVIG